MAWRIVKQPNGFFARFSSIVDDFTHINMTEKEAFEVCREDLGREESEKKLLAAVQDWKPGSTIPGSGVDRWNDSISIITAVHGKNKAENYIRIDSEFADKNKENPIRERVGFSEQIPAQDGYYWAKWKGYKNEHPQVVKLYEGCKFVEILGDELSYDAHRFVWGERIECK